MKVRETCTMHLNSSGKALQSANQLRVARLRLEDHVLRDRLKSARTAAPPVDPSTTSTHELSSRLPSALALAGKREERIKKAFSDEHHGPGRRETHAKAIF